MVEAPPEVERGQAAGVGARIGYDTARRAFMREDWAVGTDAFRAALASGASPAPLDRLLFQIGRTRQTDDPESLATLKPAMIRAAGGEAAMRRLLVGPFVKAGRQSEAAVALEKLLLAYPGLTDARRQLAGILARLNRWDEAIDHLDQAATLCGDDAPLQATRLQYRLMAGHAADAARVALEVCPRLAPDAPEHHLVLLSLIRSGRVADAADLADKLDPRRLGGAQVAATATLAMVLAGDRARAIRFGEAAIAAGHDSAGLRANLGEAVLRTGRPADIASKAIEHLGAAVAQSPDDPRANALYGEALLRTNRHEDAVRALEKANAREARTPMVRNFYARALRAVGRYSEAADQYVELLQTTPDRWAWYRQTVGVLVQAGRGEEASSLFNEMVAKRSAALPDTFEAGMADIPNRLQDAPVTKARLDWAWGLRHDHDDGDRAEWERRARWGALADLLILDWLECREHQAEEVMALLSDLDGVEETLAPLRETGKGFVIATAHIGPMFAGPLILELLGLPSRWVSSTPAISNAHYATTLISTSDQTDGQVARACLRAIQSNYAVGIAIDGSGRMGAPTTRFDGQDIAYSDFASRMAFKAATPTLFYAPRWKDGRIGVSLEILPPPEPDEAISPFVARWRAAYLSFLRQRLGGAPENLRLVGGLWGCVRAPV